MFAFFWLAKELKAYFLIIFRFVDPISSLLSSFGPEIEQTINAFKSQGLEYSTLSGLNKDDLMLLGISNQDIQEKMLKDFGSLPGSQETHFDKTLREIDLVLYEDNLIQNIEEHFTTMKTLLTATHLKLSIVSIQDVIVNDRKFSSDVILKVVNRMIEYSEQICSTVYLPKREKSLKDFKRKLTIKNYLKTFARVGILSIGGFFLTLL